MKKPIKHKIVILFPGIDSFFVEFLYKKTFWFSINKFHIYFKATHANINTTDAYNTDIILQLHITGIQHIPLPLPISNLYFRLYN